MVQTKNIVYDELTDLNDAALTEWAIRSQVAELVLDARAARERPFRRSEAAREAARCDALAIRLLRLLPTDGAAAR